MMTILSASGSRKAPLRLTTLDRRATRPSKKSVLARAMPSPKAAHDAPRSASASSTNQNNNGAKTRRARVNRLAG